MEPVMSYMQKKKKVEGKYNPDTFRVISDVAVTQHPKFEPKEYRSSFQPPTPTVSTPGWNLWPHDSAQSLPLKGTCVLPQLTADYRAHNPHPLSCGFLNSNVRFLMEPVCHVYTAPVQHEEKLWWPCRSNKGNLHIPPFTENTHYRHDYNLRHGERPPPSGRFTANINKEPALGTVPVNFLKERDGAQRLYQEEISYEHVYNSRADPNYPIRGKRHGAFVWKKLDPISQKKFIQYYERLKQQQQNGKENGGQESQINDEKIIVIRSQDHM